MADWLSGVDVITLFVDDLDITKSFYSDVFDANFVYEDDSSAVFKLRGMMVNLLDATSAPELIEPAAVAPAGSGAKALFTIEVPDVDEACTELARRGVTLLNGPMDRPWGIRTAAFADPSGHMWEICHDLPQS